MTPQPNSLASNAIDTGPAQRLVLLEATIRRGLATFIEVGNALAEIRDARLYREQGFRTFEDYCLKRWRWGRNYANKQIAAARVIQNLGTTVPKSITERQARELVSLSPEQQCEVAATIDFTTATAKDIHIAVKEIGSAAQRTEGQLKRFITVEEWKALSAHEKAALLIPKQTTANFNPQDNNSVEWALQTHNPITGCWHNCPYCYARDIAERFYPQKFQPSLWPDRLAIPLYRHPPKEADTDPSYRNVFVCSMADLFGQWVPAEWIEAVLGVSRKAKDWNFLMLTKFPQRYKEFDLPDNVWAGTSIDMQARVPNAERAMRECKAKIKWLSIEPLIEPITIDLSIFQWIVIGGASKSSQTPEWRPPRAWVEDLTKRAQAAGCAVYHKANLDLRLRDYPGFKRKEPTCAPPVFHYLKAAQ
jgi:protein gp37